MTRVEDASELRRLIEARLQDTRPASSPEDALPGGVDAVNADLLREYFPPAPAPAAVLVPLVERPEGLTVLLTERATHLTRHAGQISFPGGRLESEESAVEGALRETEEEIGLARDYISVVGFLQPHLVITGYWITPVVGFVRPGFELRLDPREVAATFEVPLTHILDPRNHQSRERLLGSTPIQVYDIPYGSHRIWGATAGILIHFCRVLGRS